MININENNKVLQELFSLPIGLEKVKNFPGPPIYTSNTLKRRYIESMRKSSRANILADKVEELVNKELVIPAFLNKGIFRFALSKIFGDPETKDILGFYMSETKKIYILINNNINFFGYANNDWMSSLLLHESQHMCADLRSSKFYSLFKSDFMEFYSNLFTKIFKLKSIDKSLLERVIKFIFNIELKFPLNNNTLKNYHDLLMEFQSISSNKDEFEKTLRDYIVIIKIFWTSLSGFIRVSRNYRHILGPIYDTYSSLYKITPNSTCIQELITLSEIIAVMSETNTKLTPKIYKSFKMI